MRTALYVFADRQASMADIAVIVLYLVGITALGVWMARRVKHVGDFIMPRRFGKGMMIMHAFGTDTASDQAIIALAIMFVASVTGRITKLGGKSKLDRLYGLVRTPVQPGEVIDRPCELPPGVAADARRMITTAFGLEIFVPSRASVIGFVATWAAVAILIRGFVAFVWW